MSTEEIYIDCKPTDERGNTESDDKKLNAPNYSEQMIEQAAEMVDKGEFFNNIGFQSVLGVSLLAILYYVGNYVFVTYPKSMLSSRIKSSSS